MDNKDSKVIIEELPIIDKRNFEETEFPDEVNNRVTDLAYKAAEEIKNE